VSVTFDRGGTRRTPCSCSVVERQRGVHGFAGYTVFRICPILAVPIGGADWRSAKQGKTGVGEARGGMRLSLWMRLFNTKWKLGPKARRSGRPRRGRAGLASKIWASGSWRVRRRRSYARIRRRDSPWRRRTSRYPGAAAFRVAGRQLVAVVSLARERGVSAVLDRGEGGCVCRMYSARATPAAMAFGSTRRGRGSEAAWRARWCRRSNRGAAGLADRRVRIAACPVMSRMWQSWHVAT